MGAGYNNTFKTVKQKTIELGSALRKTKRDNANLGDAFNKTSLKIKQSERRTFKYTSVLGKLHNQQKKARGSNKQLAEKIKLVESRLKKSTNTADKYKVKLGDVIKKQKSLGRESVILESKLKRLNNQQRYGARLKTMKGKALGVGGTVYGAGRIIGKSLDFEHRLASFGNVGKLDNKQLSAIRSQLKETSMVVNQDALSLLSGVDFLVGKGLTADVSMKAIQGIGKTSTATGADLLDMARVAHSSLQNMKVDIEEVDGALELLAVSGDMGGFELDKMAPFLPKITASAQAVGLKGKKGLATIGASLQVASLGAGSDGEAANNFNNFLDKLTAPDTVKRFEKMGVNIEQVFKKSMLAGKDPVIEMIKLTQQLTGGDKFRVGELFGDQQVKAFLTPMLANLDLFERIKKASLEQKVINKKFNTMMDTGKEKLKAGAIAVSNLADSFSTTLKPATDVIIGGLKSATQWSAYVGEKHKWLSVIVGGVAGGFIILTSGVAAFTGVMWLANTAVMATTFNIIKTVAGAALASTVFGVATAKTIALTSAQWLLNVAIGANPVGAVILAIGAVIGGAILLYKNWSSVTEWFNDALTAIADKFSWIGELWDGFFGSDDEKNVSLNVKTNNATAALSNIDKAAKINQLSRAAVVSNNEQQIKIDAPITIYAAKNMDEKQIGKQVALHIKNQQRQAKAKTRGALYDIQ